MKKLIGFSGRKCSGKSMFANMLKENHGAEVISLANPIKELCARLLGITVERLNELKNEGDELQSAIVAYQPKQVWMDTIAAEVPGIPLEAVSEWADSVMGNENYTARMMLQTIGTELIRKHDEDWHIRRMLESVRKSAADTVVVDDIRFPNEKEAFEKAGGKAYFIIRPDLALPISNHSSENSLHWYDFDFDSIILNMYEEDFMKREFEKIFTEPAYGNGSPIIAYSHEPTGDDRGFGRFVTGASDPQYCHYMAKLVIPSMVKHNGCIVLNTDSVSVMKWFECHLPYAVWKQIDPHSTQLQTLVCWNPFVIENIKEWLNPWSDSL